jgi:predicted dehydrogenase
VKPLGVAVVGCGAISQEYLRNLCSYPDLRVVACVDLDLDRARAAAERHRVPVVGELDAVLEHPDVELVVNLTVPAAHTAVSMAAVLAGRHVYSEKPLALDPAAAGALLAEADAAGVRVGGAPDTFLGAGWQATYRLLRDGVIGTPLSALAVMQDPGPDRWHHNPEFYFQPGGGPLFDMGPYYLTALAALFGPVTRVAGTARTGHPERVVKAGPRAGAVLRVDVATHVAALLDFAGGQTASVVFSFDSPLARQDLVEITGTTATLAAPDPNSFAGPVRLRQAGSADWTTMAAAAAKPSRGLGVLDLARALATGRPHRASGALARHVVDVMTAILESADRAEFVAVRSTFEPPELLPPGWDPHLAVDQGGDG